MNRRFLMISVFAALAAAVLPWPASRPASAQQTITLKIATLAPANSSWFRVFNAWNQSLQQATQNQVSLQFVSRGRTADEREFVTGMQGTTYDGAVLTANGLGIAAPASLGLALPGLVTEYDQLDRVRQRLSGDLDQVFASAPNGGYKLLGWADVGRGRIFANQPVTRPAVLAGRPFWAGRDDLVAAALVSAGNASRQQTPMAQVSRALDGGQINTVYASALAVVSLNWHSRLTHVSQQSLGVIIGATLLKQSAFDRVPQQHRAALLDPAARAHQALARTIRRDDDRNLQTALSRGVQQFDLNANRAEWEQLTQRARASLVGRTVPQALVTKIQNAR